MLLEFEPSQLSTELCTDELLEQLPQEVIDALDFDESEAVLAAFVDQEQPLQVDPFDLLLDEDPSWRPGVLASWRPSVLASDWRPM